MRSSKPESWLQERVGGGEGEEEKNGGGREGLRERGRRRERFPFLSLVLGLSGSFPGTENLREGVQNRFFLLGGVDRQNATNADRQQTKSSSTCSGVERVLFFFSVLFLLLLFFLKKKSNINIKYFLCTETRKKKRVEGENKKFFFRFLL